MRKLAWMACALLLSCAAPLEATEEACRATLVSGSAPWLHAVAPDPAGGYVAVGNAHPGPYHAFYRLNDELEIVSSETGTTISMSWPAR